MNGITKHQHWDRKARLFHHHNPEVFDRIVLECESVLQTQTRVGMESIFDRIRHAHPATNKPAIPLNNNYAAFYKRLVIHKCPHLRHLFETRASGSDHPTQGTLI